MTLAMAVGETAGALAPSLELDPALGGAGYSGVSLRPLPAALLTALKADPDARDRLRPTLRVAVEMDAEPGDAMLPGLSGDHILLADGIGFAPHFPFEPGVAYRASFDTEAVREPIAIERWMLSVPEPGSRQPLTIRFAQPMDRAMLVHAIAVENGQPLPGRIAIAADETEWMFAPATKWQVGAHRVVLAPGLEDVRGNGLFGPFDRPLRADAVLAGKDRGATIPFVLP